METFGFFFAMRGGPWSWASALLVPIALVIVYPRDVLEWRSRKTGRTYFIRDLLVLEAAALTAMVLGSLFLDFLAPRFSWWEPLALIGGVALFRGLKAALANLLG